MDPESTVRWQSVLSAPWPILILWLAISVPYTVRTPGNSYSHDFAGHVGYAQILHDQKRLPHAGEGWETHQPPLYYLIAGSLAFDSPHHVLFVRLFSIGLGGAVLWLLHRTMSRLKIRPTSIFLSLAFLATTPHFIFIFSTYNNDALLTFLAVGTWILFLHFVESPTWKLSSSLGVVALIGFFTKLSFGAVLASIVAVALYLVRCRDMSFRVLKRLIAPQVIVLLVFFGFLYVHNYRASGQWIPTNWHGGEPWQHIPHSAMQSILTPPGFTSWEWVTPFTDHFLPIGKKNSLTAYLLSSSIFGEHTFRQLKDGWIWFIFWSHVLWLSFALTRVVRTRVLSLMGIALGMGWLALAGFVLVWPYGNTMDFRHVAWICLPLSILRADVLDHPGVVLGPVGQRIFMGVIVLGIFAQWLLISLL